MATPWPPRRADLRFHDELLADVAGARLVDVKLGQWTMSRETQRVAEVHAMSIVFGVPLPSGVTITGRFARHISAKNFLQSVWRRRGLASDEPRCTAVLGRLETLAAETIRLARGERS